MNPTIADLVAAYQAAYEIAHSIAVNHGDWTAELGLAKKIMEEAGDALYQALPASSE